MKTILIKIIAFLFRKVPLPETFPGGDLKNITFVTLDNSIILDGLLLALSQKAGLIKISDCLDPIENRSDRILYRTNLHDETNLARLATQSSNHFFVTVNTIHGIGPIKTTRNYTINVLDAMSLLLGMKFLVVVFGEPRKLDQNLLNPHLKLSRVLKVDFYQILKLIRGTPLQSLRTQSQQILSGKDYNAELERISADLKISADEVDKKCHKAFYEMAANPVRWVYILLASLAKFIVWHLFTNIKVDGLNNFIKATKEHPVVLVPMHRSHLDYILLGAVLYKSRLNTPLVAAGVNLNFWPVGFFLRRVGAFFVKRSGGSDPVHTFILRRYVNYLLKRGHMLEFFIEGGRSRTGRMRAPKLGLLKTIVSSYQKGIRKDVVFVPVSISYEQVIEDKLLSKENLGDKKVEENIKTLFKARSIFTRKYGEVIIKFGEPLSISKFETPVNQEKRPLVMTMARSLTEEMRIRTNPTFTSLVCTSLMMAPRYALGIDSLVQTVQNLTKLVDIYRSVNPKIGESTETLLTLLNNKSVMSERLVATGLVQRRMLFGREVFTIPEHQRMTADFYKNATIHLLIPFSFMSLAELYSGQINLNTIQKFHNIFENDFLLPHWSDFHDTTQKLLGTLATAGLVIKDGESYTKFATQEQGYYIPALMLSPIQSNLWVLYHLSQLASKWTDSKTIRVDYDEFIKSLLDNHASALDMELLTRTESFSKFCMESTLESLSARGIISAATIRGTAKAIRIIDPSKLDRSFLYEVNEKVINFLYDSVRKYRSDAARL